MKIRLLAIGTRTPTWIQQGFHSYQKRLPEENALLLVEIPAGGQRDPKQNIRIESERLMARVKVQDYVIALDEKGRNWRTQELALQLEKWRGLGRDVVLLVGGANGLSDACKQRADVCWSLSPLTLPHALVRVLVAEQIYRAWSVLSGHPYHRE